MTAYESLRNLVVASAYPVFARQHRAVQPPRKPQELTDFLRTVRIGPAMEGSYMLAVHTPVPPRLAQQQPLADGETAPWPEEGDQEPLRRIWLDLPADDYATAMRAHQEMREVSVSGSLVRRGTRYVLTRPSSFRMHGEP